MSKNINIPTQIEVTPGPPSDDLMTVAEVRAQLAKYPDNCKVLVQFAETLQVIPICDFSYGILEVDDEGNEKFETSIVSILVGEEVEYESEDEPEPEPEPVKPKKGAKGTKKAAEEPKPARAKKSAEPGPKPARAPKKKFQDNIVTPAPTSSGLAVLPENIMG